MNILLVVVNSDDLSLPCPLPLGLLLHLVHIFICGKNRNRSEKKPSNDGDGLLQRTSLSAMQSPKPNPSVHRLTRHNPILHRLLLVSILLLSTGLPNAHCATHFLINFPTPPEHNLLTIGFQNYRSPPVMYY